MARKLAIRRIRPKEIPRIVGKLTPVSGSDWASVGVAVNFLLGVRVAETEAVGDAEKVGVGLPVNFRVGVGVEVEVGIGVGVKVGAWAKGSGGADGDMLSFLP